MGELCVVEQCPLGLPYFISILEKSLSSSLPILSPALGIHHISKRIIMFCRSAFRILKLTSNVRNTITTYRTITMVKAKKFVYAHPFEGEPKISDFQLVEEELPALQNNGERARTGESFQPTRPQIPLPTFQRCLSRPSTLAWTPT